MALVFPADAPWNKRLKMLRQYREKSQQEVADELGTTRRMVQRWENAAVTPNYYSRMRICRWAGMPDEVIFRGLPPASRPALLR